MEKDIAVLQEQMRETNRKIDGLEHKVDVGFSSINRKFDEFIEKADRKYASKNTERSLYWAATLVIGAVIIALLGLVLRK